MQRSGSTFSFNIARDILEHRGTVYQEPNPHLLDVIERSDGSDHIILKAHSADDITIRQIQIGAVKSIVTIRKPEDAVASWMETFGFSLDESLDHFKDWIEMFRHIQNSSLVIPYDQIDRHPFRATRLIANFLCGHSSPLEVFNLARKYSKKTIKKFADQIEASGASVNHIGFSYYDARTFFHRRHVSTIDLRGGAQRIGDDAVSAIRASLREYVDRNGELILTGAA